VLLYHQPYLISFGSKFEDEEQTKRKLQTNFVAFFGGNTHDAAAQVLKLFGCNLELSVNGIVILIGIMMEEL
jgi:hypothetical protein